MSYCDKLIIIIALESMTAGALLAILFCGLRWTDDLYRAKHHSDKRRD